jgi:hypothetical protein
MFQKRLNTECYCRKILLTLTPTIPNGDMYHIPYLKKEKEKDDDNNYNYNDNEDGMQLN